MRRTVSSPLHRHSETGLPAAVTMVSAIRALRPNAIPIKAELLSLAVARRVLERRRARQRALRRRRILRGLLAVALIGTAVAGTARSLVDPDLTPRRAAR